MPVVPRYLSRDELLDLHDGMIRLYGGMPGVRDERILDSCLAQPKTHVFDVERFPTLIDMAAASCFFIVRNHPFFDANKRTGLAAALQFLRINGVSVRFLEEETYDVIIGVANGEVSWEGVATLIASASERARASLNHGTSNG